MIDEVPEPPPQGRYIRLHDDQATAGLENLMDRFEDFQQSVRSTKVLKHIRSEGQIHAFGLDGLADLLQWDRKNFNPRLSHQHRVRVEVDGDPPTGPDMVDQLTVARTNIQHRAAGRYVPRQESVADCLPGPYLVPTNDRREPVRIDSIEFRLDPSLAAQLRHHQIPPTDRRAVHR